MMNKKNIGIAGLIVLTLVAAGIFIYRDMRGDTEGGESTTATTTDISGISMTGDGSIKVIPIDDRNLPPAPSLVRSVEFKNTLAPEVKAIIVTRIEENIKELKSDPKNVNEWIMLGVNRKSLGDYEGARDAWEYVKAVAPSSIIAWNNLGDLYHFYLKDYVKSEENWKKTIALKPDYIQGYSGLVDLYRYSFKVKLSETPTILKAGIAKNPDSVDLQVMLAHHYQDMKQTAEAKDAYNKAIETAERIKNDSLVALLKSELSGVK
ncbi:MAG TPA: hypothetical protein DCS20_00020 [Candidatus Yonathbacteria bacterium]|nr:hypothetical protein [Candidatus Yonathbacteria bacterium]